MGRPSGSTEDATFANTLMASVFTSMARDQVTRKIREQKGLGPSEAGRASAHLRWGLEQMRLRGWSNKDWGELFTDVRGTPGQGPICILESVQGTADAPSQLIFESIEQHYIRLAFKELGVDPIPVYISEWNDAQAEFEPIETVLLWAARTAERDERAGVNRFPRDNAKLRDMFGLTVGAIVAASAAIKTESTTEGQHPTPAPTPAVDGGDAGAGPTAVHGESDTAGSFIPPHGTA
jgi:hypothetical protein